MKFITFILTITIGIIFNGCSSQQSSQEEPIDDILVMRDVDQSAIRKNKDFPPVVSLTDLRHTEFTPTLENKMAENKNVIYAPAFLFAWEEVKNILKFPIEVSEENSVDFKLINSATTHFNSLNSNEYWARVGVEGDAIVAEASFRKSLPFDSKFHSSKDSFRFLNEEVKAFGINYFEQDLVKNIQILYYKDEDHFIVKIIPKDQEHKIILSKGISLFGTLADMVKETDQLIETGKSEIKDRSKAWKYEFRNEDYLSIPVISFNIETHYENLEGQKFQCNSTPHIIAIAQQRTAFMMDESGAEVESEALVVVDSVGAEPVETPTPKKLVFDKPFLIYIKRTDMPNPYFVMKVDNSELMVKK